MKEGGAEACEGQSMATTTSTSLLDAITSFFSSSSSTAQPQKTRELEVMDDCNLNDKEAEDKRERESGETAPLLEIFPQLDVNVLKSIGQEHEGDLDTCIEIALAIAAGGSVGRGGEQQQQVIISSKKKVVDYEDHTPMTFVSPDTPKRRPGGLTTPPPSPAASSSSPTTARPSLPTSAMQSSSAPSYEQLEIEADGAAALFTSPILPLLSLLRSSSSASTEMNFTPASQSSKPSSSPPGALWSAANVLKPPRPLSASSRRGQPVQLPADFLRVPPSCIKEGHKRRLASAERYTVHLSKNNGVRGGLGVTVEERQGSIYVKALPKETWDVPNQAEKQGVRIGDMLIGINDEDFSEKSLPLRKLIDLVRALPDEVTLHLLRLGPSTITRQGPLQHNSSPDRSPQQSTSFLSSSSSSSFSSAPHWTLPTSYHKLAQQLLNEGAVDHDQAFTLTKLMMQIQHREALWKDDSFMLVTQSTTMGTSPGTTTSSSHSRRQSDLFQSSPFRHSRTLSSGSRSPSPRRHSEDYAIDPCLLVTTTELRRALALRIGATDFVGDHTVYILDVVDIESGARWRVKRRFREFFDLQEKCVTLRPSVATLDFPTRRPSLTESLTVVHERKIKLERYMRRLSGLLFYAPLHCSSCAITKLMQDFVDVPVRMDTFRMMDAQASPDRLLQAALEVSVHRVLQIPVMDRMLMDFTEQLTKGTEEEFFAAAYSIGGQGRLSGRQILESIKRYMDHLQAILLEGCADDLHPIVFKHFPELGPDEAQTHISAAIRRQVEMEVYVPVMPRLIGALKREEGASQIEAQVRVNMQIAEKKPQSFFGVPIHQISPTSWDAAVQKFRGVATNVLPCDKLASLVEAAKEIPLLYKEEHEEADKPIGADEFLPIFIYVVSQSGIYDIYLLKEVLCSLCDPNKRLSEAGYYLASFEAACEHLKEQELDIF